MKNNYKIGDKVHLNYTHDEFDRPIEKHTVFTITRVNTSEVVPHRGWDYEITAKSGNTFFVMDGEILPVENTTTKCSTIFNSEEDREYEIEQMWVRSGVQL